MKERKSDLINLLKTFTNQEFSRFTLFVNSPYYNKSQSLIALLAVLKSMLKGKENYNKAAIERVYDRIHPESDANPKKDEVKYNYVKTKMSNLLELAEEFLIAEKCRTLKKCKNHERRNVHRDGLLYDILLGRNQYELLGRRLKDAKESFRNVLPGMEQHACLAQIEKRFMDYYFQTGQLDKLENVKELLIHIDVHYLVHKLHLSQTLISLNRPTAEDTTNFEYLDAILALFDNFEHLSIPLVKLNRSAVSLMRTLSDEDYNAFYDILKNSRPEIEGYEDPDDAPATDFRLTVPDKELINFINIAGNYCMNKIITGNLEYYENLYDLYMLKDRMGFLLENGVMESGNFKNLIMICCIHKDFEKAAKFIEKYKADIAHEEAGKMCAFCNCMIDFYKGSFDRAESGLNVIYFNRNLRYEINRRTLILKSRYEMLHNASKYIESLFRREKRYFKTHKDLKQKQKEEYLNFISILEKLYKIRYLADNTGLTKLKERLDHLDRVSDRQWLEWKIEELGKKRKRLL